MTNANLAVLLGSCFVFVVVVTYILYKLFPCRGLNALLNTDTNTEVKYEPTPDVAIPAIPHEPIKWTFANAPKPEKRPYTKRSKYWTDKRKKAVAAKARKTKPK
jgi:hypothetical protein